VECQVISIGDKIREILVKNGNGWCFSGKDFTSFGNSGAIDVVLHRLESEGVIRRISHGLYDFPEHSALLNQQLSPDINQAAQAIARKFRWEILPTGTTALNYFGLSTQIPARTIYLSDGPKRSYDIMGTSLEFQKAGLKDTRLSHPMSGLIVQALKSLGRERITDSVIEGIRRRINERDFSKILRDTRYVTGWVYDIIKSVCRENSE
jgi:hypothetical protein